MRNLRARRSLAVSCFALLTVMSFSFTLKADVILSSNTENLTAGTETATGTTYLAASFSTDSSAYTLSSVTLLLLTEGLANAEVSVYSDDGYEPSSLMASLSSPSSYASSLSPAVFTSAGILLSAETTYWVVLKALSGTLHWAWTSDNSGTGIGYQGEWSEYLDLGSGVSYWASSSDFPLQMSVSALTSDTAIPEPATLSLFLLVGTLAGLRFLKTPPHLSA